MREVVGTVLSVAMGGRLGGITGWLWRAWQTHHRKNDKT